MKNPGREIPEDEPSEQQLEDMGKSPWVLNIEQATIANRNYRLLQGGRVNICKWS
jgi:hypothetical protein